MLMRMFLQKRDVGGVQNVDVGADGDGNGDVDVDVNADDDVNLM